MGVDFNAAFSRLNTNTEGSSANILDSDEIQAAKNSGSVWTLSEGMDAEAFKTANQRCAEQDANKDGVVTVKEQKASIAAQLKNVWTSKIARFFKDDISYDDSNEAAASKVTQQVKQRIQNALNYIQYAKNNNIDIFDDNEGTGVDDKDGELQNYTDSSGKTHTTTASPGVKKSVRNSDGTYTNTYNDGSTITKNDNHLQLSETEADGTNYKWNYNEDGSYSYTATRKDNSTYHVAKDKNENLISYYQVTAKGNYKACALAGETVDQTLERLGITGQAAVIVKASNPKACKAGSFRTDCADVYIPKMAIALMQNDGTFDEQRLMGVQTKPEMGV